MKNCLKRALAAHALLSTIALAAGCEEEPMAAYAPRGIEDDGGQEESDAGLIDDGSGTYIAVNETVLDWKALPLDPPRIANGNDHTCAIDVDGNVRCWGYLYTSPELTHIPNVSDAARIASGGNTTCVVDTKGKLTCWSGSENPLARDGIDYTGSYKEVAVGALHVCAIRTDDSIVCWVAATENILRGQADSPPGAFSDITAGEAHTCALELDSRRPVCWGKGRSRHELDPGGAAVPPEGLELRSISAGSIHTCGVDMDNKPVCWGPGVGADRCDNVSAEASPCGQGAPPDRDFVFISSGASHSCGIASGAALLCWGSDVFDQSTAPGGRFVQVSAGIDHTCGITLSGALRCWGLDNQLKTTPPEDFFPED